MTVCWNERRGLGGGGLRRGDAAPYIYIYDHIYIYISLSLSVSRQGVVADAEAKLSTSSKL